MREDAGAFDELNTRIAVVARHKPDKVSDYWKSHHLPFTGIPDPDGKLGDLYGQEKKLLKLGLMPAQFIISQQKQILFAHYGTSMADIPENKDMLAMMRSF